MCRVCVDSVRIGFALCYVLDGRKSPHYISFHLYICITAMRTSVLQHTDRFALCYVLDGLKSHTYIYSHLHIGITV